MMPHTVHTGCKVRTACNRQLDGMGCMMILVRMNLSHMDCTRQALGRMPLRLSSPWLTQAPMPFWKMSS